MKKSIFTIPNLLSFFRLCLIPLIVIAYLREYYQEATILLVISGVTDTLDGFIARHFHQISDFGKLIDPVADKLTLAAVVFALLLHHKQLLVTMGVLIVKESLSLIAAYILYHRGVRPSESKSFGKLSTLSLYLVSFIIMITDIAEVTLAPWLIWSMVGLTCLCMILAMFQYYPIYIGIIRGNYNIETEQFEGDPTK
ncbi:MAG: CDP-alcohol phosphatidyltransferase family protein [Clostridia bacterium]|nr:CDP-alcohol phosphatidyltransferase family protein [Clostridia bacterium]